MGKGWENRDGEGILWDPQALLRRCTGEVWDAQGGQEILRDCSGNAPGMIRERCSGCMGVTPWILRGHSVDTPVLLSGYSRVTQWILKGCSEEAWDAHMDVHVGQELLRSYSGESEDAQVFF